MIKLRPLIENKASPPYRRRPIDDQNLMLKLRGSEYKSAIEKSQNDHNIYRGIHMGHPLDRVSFFEVSPAQHYRSSRNTSNVYTVLVDNLPSWKDYPKRSRSIICSTSISAASSFGHVYAVLPKNGTKIGVCPRGDFWMSFEKLRGIGISDMDSFNTIISFFLRFVNIDSEVLSHKGDTMYKPMLHNLNERLRDIYVIKNIIIGEAKAKYGSYTAKRAIEGGFLLDIEKNFKGDWEQYLDNTLNPKSNGFLLKTIEDYNMSNKKNNELWTDGDSILIREVELSGILNMLKSDNV